ncbi:MAG: hypothetical protein AAF594_08280 [Bacteroidota bacterium]
MRWTVLGLLVAVAGCDTSAIDGVGASLLTDAEAYVAESKAEVQLVNETDDRVLHPVLDCADLQVRTDDGWEDTETAAVRTCPDVLYELDGGAADVAAVVLDVAPGTYRFRMVVYLDGTEAVGVATAPFDVAPAAD